MEELNAWSVLSLITSGNLDSLKGLVAQYGSKAILMDNDPDELTTLHHASRAGQLAIVTYLLAAPIGADPQAMRMNNFTPLHAAAMQGHADVCQVLLKAGAQVNVQTQPQGYAPLHSAAFAGHLNAIKVLLESGADKTVLNYRNERPADTARRTGQIEAAKLIES